MSTASAEGKSGSKAASAVNAPTTTARTMATIDLTGIAIGSVSDSTSWLAADTQI